MTKPLPAGFKAIEEIVDPPAVRRVPGDTVGVDKNVPYLSRMTINIGPDLVKQAGLSLEDRVDVYCRGRGILVRKGSRWAVSKSGNQLRVQCPPVWAVEKGFRVVGTADPESNSVYFVLGPDAKLNRRVVKS